MQYDVTIGGRTRRVIVQRAGARWRVTLDGAVHALVGDLGPVDVLVTSAGYAHPGRFVDLDAAVFRDQMEVDYFGTLHAVRAVAPSMVERRRGHLVLVSSTVAFVGIYGYSAYASRSKRLSR